MKAFTPAPDIIVILDKSSPDRYFSYLGSVTNRRTSDLHSSSQRSKIGMIDYKRLVMNVVPLSNSRLFRILSRPEKSEYLALGGRR